MVEFRCNQYLEDSEMKNQGLETAFGTSRVGAVVDVHRFIEYHYVKLLAFLRLDIDVAVIYTCDFTGELVVPFQVCLRYWCYFKSSTSTCFEDVFRACIPCVKSHRHPSQPKNCFLPSIQSSGGARRLSIWFLTGRHFVVIISRDVPSSFLR